MRFEKLDLNLLVALNALIEERSVSVAAERLCLTQSAVSSALNRLREFFSDELLTKSGRQMILTPRAQQLADPVHQALSLIRSRITTPQGFNPATSERGFVIQASDYIFDLMLAPVFRKAAKLAPRVTFNVRPISSHVRTHLQRGDIDLFFGIRICAPENHVYIEDHPHSLLFTDNHSVICAAGSKYASSLSEDDFYRAGHVAVQHGPEQVPAFTEQVLASHGIRRRIELVVPTFLSLPRAVVETPRLAVVFSKYAELFSTILPIAVKPLPATLPRCQAYVQWNSSFNDDEGIQWLVGLLEERAREIDHLQQTAC